MRRNTFAFLQQVEACCLFDISLSHLNTLITTPQSRLDVYTAHIMGIYFRTPDGYFLLMLLNWLDIPDIQNVVKYKLQTANSTAVIFMT